MKTENADIASDVGAHHHLRQCHPALYKEAKWADVPVIDLCSEDAEETGGTAEDRGDGCNAAEVSEQPKYCLQILTTNVGKGFASSCCGADRSGVLCELCTARVCFDFMY